MPLLCQSIIDNLKNQKQMGRARKSNSKKHNIQLTHSHSHLNNQMRNYGGHGRKNYESIINIDKPPVIINGVLLFSGSQSSAQLHFDNLETFYQQQTTRKGDQKLPIKEARLFIVGKKVYEGDTLCVFLTYFFAVFLIFPILFTFCNWWKRLTEPQYQMSLQTYQAFSRFLDNSPNVNSLILDIVDNSFNAQKAELLYNSLKGRKLIGLTFINRASCINYRQDQYKKFADNIGKIRVLSIRKKNIVWGSNAF